MPHPGTALGNLYHCFSTIILKHFFLQVRSHGHSSLMEGSLGARISPEKTKKETQCFRWEINDQEKPISECTSSGKVSPLLGQLEKPEVPLEQDSFPVRGAGTEGHNKDALETGTGDTRRHWPQSPHAMAGPQPWG